MLHTTWLHTFHWGCGGLGAQLRLGLALLLGLQEQLLGLEHRQAHLGGGGLDIEGLPSQLGRTRDSTNRRTRHIFPTQAGEVVESVPGWLARSELVRVGNYSQFTATQSELLS